MGQLPKVNTENEDLDLTRGFKDSEHYNSKAGIIIDSSFLCNNWVKPHYLWEAQDGVCIVLMCIFRITIGIDWITSRYRFLTQHLLIVFWHVHSTRKLRGYSDEQTKITAALSLYGITHITSVLVKTTE